MAEMVWSALAQEAVSRVISYFVPKRKREEKASHGHLMERLEKAVNDLEFALERAKELRIRHRSLIGCRNHIMSVYVEAMELLDKHKQQLAVPPGQEVQDKKRRRWNLWPKYKPIASSFAGLSTDNVRRVEWYANYAGNFVRDVESGCSLHHNTFCNPIVRHLLEGKTLRYYLKQGNLQRRFFIWPTYSDDRGVEAVLDYRYGNKKTGPEGYRYDNSPMTEKSFNLVVFLRLSESTDIVGAAIKGLQLFTSEFKLEAECAMGELILLSSNSQNARHYYGPPPWVGYQEWYINGTQMARPDPACCKGTGLGLCAKDNVSSGLADIFPEEVIVWCFGCYSIPAIEPSRSSCSSFDVVGRSNSRGGGKPPLALTAIFAPHHAIATGHSFALRINGDVKESRDARIQQVAETLKSDAINCFFRQPELTEYKIILDSKHGSARFIVKKARMERAGAPKTKRRHNRRGSTRRGSPPKAQCRDKWQTYEYGRSLINLASSSSLPTQMYKLNRWYLDACKKKERFIRVRVRDQHYFHGDGIIHVEFSELHQLFHQDALDKSLISCFCLKEMLEHKKRGTYDVGFFDPYTIFHDNVAKWPVQIVRKMSRFLDKQRYKSKILFPFHFNFHWILLVIELDKSRVCILDSMRKDRSEYQDMLDLLQSVWLKFTKRYPVSWKVPLSIVEHSENGTNLCGYYVCEHLMRYSLKTSEEYFEREWMKQKVIRSEQIRAIQESLAGFINDQVLSHNGEFYDDGSNLVHNCSDEDEDWMES